MTRVITDATVLIYLARLDELAVLDGLFDATLVPSPVYDEVVEQGRAEGYADALDVEAATETCLEVVPLEESAAEVADRIRETAELGSGETATIALATETDARCLTDDHAARQTAESLGIPIGGTIYVLLRVLDDGRYTLPEFVSRLDKLDDAGFRMSASLYRQAIDAAEDRVEQ